MRTEEDALYSTHEEADSRIFHHINTLPKPSSVVIMTVDTYILVIAVWCRIRIEAELKIWMEARFQANNTLRYISVDQMCYDLGEKLFKALPAYHAFTGSDYSASFSRKGKREPFKKLERDIPSQIAFGRLGGVAPNEIIRIFPQIERFTYYIWFV